MPDAFVNRVYDIKIGGYTEAEKNLKTLTSLFTKMDETKRKTDEQLKKAVEAGNAKAIEQLSAKVKELETNLKSLDAQRKASAKEVEILAKAEKLEAEARLTNTKAVALQDKEEERKAGNDAKRNRQTSSDLKLISGNYYDLLRLQKQYTEAYKLTDPSSPFFEAARKNAIAATQAVQNFNRSLSPDGTLVGEYKSGILNAFKDLGLSDVIKKQKDDITNQINQVKNQNKALAEQYRVTSVAGGEAFNKVGKELQENIALQGRLENSLHSINSTLGNTGSIGNRITSSIKEGFKGLTQQATQFALSYVGIQAAFQAVISGIDTAKELSDQTTNLEIELDKTAGGADKLVASLAKLDTRTKLSTLEEIANIAAKAGVSENNLVGVTAALDKIKIAFGKDFGDVETGTESLVKLINVFEGTDKVTGENLLKAGNAVRTLANESVASVPFLNDFSKRMAGLKGIADISLPAVLGLASGFEQFGQSSEVAGTALTKIIPKLATDTAKYAAIAGITQQAFSDLLKNNPAEALIKVSEALVKSGTGIEEISEAFKDSELGSGRIAAVLGTVGSKAEDFRHSIASAGKAYTDTGNIEAAFAAKNDNLAATLDKISKKFADAAGSKAFLVTLGAIGTAIAFVIGNLPLIISLTSLYALGLAVANRELVAQKLNLFVVNAQLIAGRVALALVTILQTAYNGALAIYTGVARLATISTTLLGNAMRFLPLGLILTLIGLIAAGFRAFGSYVSGTTEELRKQAIQAKLLADIHREATAAIADQQAKAAALATVVKDLSISEETRRKALNDLIAIDPVFQKTLVDGKINTNNLNAALVEYNGNLLKKAELEASSARQAKEFQELVRLQSIKQGIEIAKAQKKGYGDLTDDERNAFSKISTSVGRTNLTSTLFNSSISKSDFDIALKDINVEIKKQTEVVGVATDLYKNKFTDANRAIIDGNKQLSGSVQSTTGIIQALEQKIKDLTEQRSVSTSVKQISSLTSQIKAAQAELDKLLGNNKTPVTKASRLTGEQKDAFKDIDAIRDTQLANEKKRFLELQIDEETYINNVLRINETAIDAKLKLIKGKNAEERKQIADLHLDRITQEQETSKKLFDIYAKRTEVQRDLTNRGAQQVLDKVLENPNATFTQRSEARQAFNIAQLNAQTTFNDTLLGLEKTYNQRSVENENNRAEQLVKIRKAIREESAELLKAQLKDLEEAGDAQRNLLDRETAEQTVKILSGGGTNKDKGQSLADLEKSQTLKGFDLEIDALKSATQKKFELFAKGFASEKEYRESLTKLRQAEANKAGFIAKQEESYISKTQDLFKTALNNITGFFTGQKAAQADIDKAIAAGVNATKQAINEAYQGYFEGEKQRVERDKQVALDRLSIEQKQAEGVAQSEAEKESIRKQYDIKRAEAEKRAAEQKKAIALKQLAIEFAVSVVKTLAEYPFPYSLIPVAGLTALYLVQRSNIQKQAFAAGGQVKPLQNGKITEPSNIPVQSNGDSVLATVRPGEVILNEEQQKRAGGSRFFRSLGVPGFADGGLIQPLGGGNGRMWGDNLQPPINPSSFLLPNGSSNTGVSADVQQLKQMVSDVTSSVNNVSRRIDLIKVQVVAGEVDETNKKTKKASSIGTLS